MTSPPRARPTEVVETLRILVTGSRGWRDKDSLRKALHQAWGRLGPNVDAPSLTIVHGACPDGADELANQWAIDVHANIERHPADWNKSGKGAGHIRNAKMALLGADICLAFWDGKSPGTHGMIVGAVKSGIPVWIVPQRDGAIAQAEAT